MQQVRKILKNEISLAISIIALTYTVIAMVILPIKSIQKDIEIINTNHLMHIQDSVEVIKDELHMNTSEHRQIMLNMEKLSTILDQHLK